MIKLEIISEDLAKGLIDEDKAILSHIENPERGYFLYYDNSIYRKKKDNYYQIHRHQLLRILKININLDGL